MKYSMTVSSVLAASAFTALAVLFAGCESSDSGVTTSYWSEKGEAGKNEPAAPASASTPSQATASSNSKASAPQSAPAAKNATAPSESPPAPSSGGAADQVSFGALTWTYGGFNGSRAAKTSASIGGLSMSGNKLSYSWTGDTLASWGLADGDAKALACLFVKRSDGSWVGGKFDWISTSRRSRNLGHTNGYGGWTLAGVPNPCAAAFVIVSADGKKRTNVITTTWAR